MRKYGQHFLVNARIIESIIAAVPPAATHVLEIGPGRGALTEKLIQLPVVFTAVEIDPDMETYLLQHFPGLARHIVQADFMQFDLRRLPHVPTFVVSNLPYIDAADILNKVLSWPYFSGAVFMFQKEQAVRILARVGQEGYGPLSILTQVRAEPALLLKVGKACFNPPPKVESAVLTFQPKKWLIDSADYPSFVQLILAAFKHRRKTLFNSLSLSGYEKQKIEQALEACGLPHNVRAEAVCLENWIVLFTQLKK